MSSSSDGVVELPEPLPWLDRAGAMIWLPGTPEQILDRLEHFLRSIDAESLTDDEIRWPDTGETLPLRTIIGHYGKCGLLTRTPSRLHGYALSQEARHWLETRDDDYLIGILHANVRFVGELLNTFEDRTTHEQLRDAAEDHFGIGWKTYDQLRRRTLWLRAAGCLELWSNLELVITDHGRELRNRLTCADPSELPHNREEDPLGIEITPPPDAIREELDKLTQAKLRDRKRAISYIPGGEVISTITDLVTSVDPTSTREAFYEYCENAYGISHSSADSALNTLRSGGVIEQTGQNSFSPSDLARAWLESGYSIDLVRIFHSRFIGLGEALAAVATGENSGQVGRYLSEHFSISQLPAAEVTRRIRVLHSAGLLDRITQFDYRINASGKAFLTQIPILNDTGGEAGEDSSTPDDSVSHGPESRPAQSEAGALAVELVEASTDAANYKRLERASAAAFDFLGFRAQHLGLAGRTDVLLTAWLAPGETKTLIVDAKASSAGLVEERAVQFDALEDHRKKYSAEGVAVVGSEFAPRLQQWARSRGVALIRAADLAQWVKRHAEVPLSLARFVEIFESDDRKAMRVEWESARQRQELFAGVIQKLWECANDDTHIRVSGGALNARDLWLLLRSEHPDAQLTDIDAALRFLSSELVGAVRRGKQEGFYLVEPPAVVVRKLRSLTQGVEPSTPDLQLDASTLPEKEEGDAAAADEADADLQTKLDPGEVRRWAVAQGISSSTRGRLPGRLLQQYREAHGL